jgi:hypothetical protein
MIKRAITIMLLLASVAGASQYYALHHARRGRVTDAWAAAGLNEGLVSYWAMRTNTATTVYDEWGTNTATAVNSPTFSEANGVRDDGVGFVRTSSQYMSIADADAFSFTDGSDDKPFSISAWVKAPSFGATQDIMIKFQSPTAEWQTVINATGKAVVTLYNASGDRYISKITAENIPTNNFIHICYTYSGSKSLSGLNIYTNGFLASTTTTTSGPYTGMSNGSSPVYINAFPGVPRYGNLSIDEVAIWNRALSSNEVYQIYNTPLYAPYKQ